MKIGSLSLAALAVLVVAPAAYAGHALDEPSSFGKIVKAAATADVDKALVAAGIGDRCKDALLDSGVRGLECRAAAATLLTVKHSPDKKADVDARAALFGDLTHASASVSSWDPIAPPPGLSRARFDAHRAISVALMSLYDDVVTADAKANADVHTQAEAFLHKGTDPKSGACAAAQRTVELSVGADASLQERGAVQALLTSHACFLDESRLRVDPKPGKALAGSKDAATLAASTSAKGEIGDYANSRKLDLGRCSDKHIKADGKAIDNKKLEDCACGAMARWHFPAPKEDTDVSIPLSSALSIRLSVSANGSIHSCGPVVAGGDAQ